MTRRNFTLASLSLCGALLALTGAPWVAGKVRDRADPVNAGQVLSVSVTGRDVAPALVAVILAAAAAVIVAAISGRRIRLIALGLVGGLAIGVVGVSIAALTGTREARDFLISNQATATDQSIQTRIGALDGTLRPTPWPGSSVFAGVVLLVMTVAAVRSRARWPHESRKYESPSAPPTEAWGMLSQGLDPTDENGSTHERMHEGA